MKILAIRGKNLASLAGEFAVDFQLQPLASVGLFAISGPTGAGKSTLLDALCLALYDKTPRLQLAGSQGVHLRDVGKETLPPHDVRNLLRRGCAEGFAEVDFIGHDQQHYRSRWSVRRAKAKSDGKLQAAEMLFTRLTDQQRLGGTKTEVQKLIVEKLGLNFDQFTRAVLLAQNEFSVFLKARDDERAGLLETLTGTDEYSRLSVRAFERAKLERQSLEALDGQLAQQQPLSAEQREELSARQQSIAAAVAEADKQKQSLDSYMQWHERYRALQSAEQAALSDIEQRQAEQEQAQERRKQLKLVEQVQDARPLLAECDRLSADCIQRGTQLKQAGEQLELARQVENAEHLRVQQAQQQLAQAEMQQQEAAEGLSEARALDTAIATLQPTYRQYQQSLQTQLEKQNKLLSELNQKQRHQQECSVELAQIEDWLAQHAELELLSKQWPRWQALFQQANNALSQSETALAQQKSHEQDLQTKQQSLAEIQGDWTAQKQAVHQAKEAYQISEIEAAAYDADALTTGQVQSSRRLGYLQQAQQLYHKLAGLQAEQTQVGDQLQMLHRQRQIETENLAGSQQALPALIAAHEQSEKMLGLLRLTCSDSVEKLRANLQEDSACPVCGSKDHPYVAGRHPFQDELQVMQQEVARCLEQRKTVEQQQSRAELSIEQVDKQISAFDERLSGLQSQIQQQQAQWLQLALADELKAVEPANIADWFSDEISQAETEQEKFNDALKAMTIAQNRREQARQALDKAAAVQSELQEKADTIGKQCTELALRRDACSAQHQNLQQGLRQILQDLDMAFEAGDWQQAWRQQPGQFEQQCQQQAQQWQSQYEQRQDLQRRLLLFGSELESLQQQVQQAEAQTQSARTAFNQLDEQLQQKQRQRALLFAGRSIVEVEAELDETVTTAKQQLQQFQQSWQQQEKELARRREAHSQLSALLENLQHQRAGVEQALNVWLEQCNQSGIAGRLLDLEELRALSQFDRDWIKHERQVLDTVEQALLQAQTVLNERRRQCEQHLQNREDLRALEELMQQRNELLDQLKTLQQQHADLSLQIRQDDERRQNSVSLLQARDAQSKVFDTWNKLSDLIGSSDGKKFRNIAQQITLDILLGYANRHLKDLSRRYRLERVPRTLALQVVDQDMADEIRSVHSLSGGESFLLSLALALGLASLSSNRVKVESLFIDEGFGSLDAETLRVAMDALDSLQALGRKVGVISHVQEMTERIGTRIEVQCIASGVSRLKVGF